ncbi:MAG: hypothetical protein GF346_10930 [Candidatus Eisenbacteria bacterium]|nr:hypothetical protein [Candidatus Latescibacterota bacterium]MBD3302951.1 hypothetical protein [Candidatus Eisenbacteria bacterium]
MRSLLLTLCILALAAAPAVAGKNAGGAMIVHTQNSEQYTGIMAPCGATYDQYAPASCEEAVTQADIGSSSQRQLLWYLAAFHPDADPGVTVVYFGHNHNFPPGEGWLDTWNFCGPDGTLEVADPGWPEEVTAGNSVAFGSPIVDEHLFPFYWFGAYGFEGAFMATGANPTGGYAGFVSDDNPGVLDEIDKFGTLRFYEPGENECPAPPVQCEIVVETPNGGETWEVGQEYEIQWTGDGCSETIQILLMHDGEECAVIGTEIPNTGSHLWTAEQCNGFTDGYTIEISDPANDASDASDAPFSIFTANCATDVTETEESYQVILDSATKRGGPLGLGDVVRLYADYEGEEIVVGAMAFDGSYPMDITAWERTDDLPGYTPGEPIVIKLCESPENPELCGEPTWTTGGNYGEGSFSQASLVAFDSCVPVLPPPTLLNPENGAVCQEAEGILDWEDVDGAIAYTYRIGTACGEGNETEVTASEAPYAELDPGTTYFWQVKTKNAEDVYGEYSDCFSFTVEPTPLGPPALQAPQDEAVCQEIEGILDWDDVESATGYTVQIGTACGEGEEFEVEESQYPYAGLDPATTYFWRVKTRNECDATGDYSACFSFTTDPGPLAAPALETPADEAVDVPLDGTLQWADVEGAVAYTVQIGTACGEGDEIEVTESEFAYSGLDYETEYFWRVKTLNECGEYGVYSACFSFTTVPPDLLPPPALQLPEDGAICQAIEGTLDWSDVDGATGYRVQIGTACGEGEEFEVDESQYAYAGLDPATTYFWRVQTRGEGDAYGPYSDCFSFTTDPGPLAAPALLEPPDGAVDQPVAGLLDWSDVPGATAYTVQIGTNCEEGPEMEVVDSQYAYSDLDYETIYFWRVKTKNECGAYGAYSDCFYFSTEVFEQTFVRGDTNADGVLDIRDAFYHMVAHRIDETSNLYPPCFDAVDFDDTGEITLDDLLGLLDYLYEGGAEPPPPFPECGTDPTEDPLDCESFPPCDPGFLVIDLDNPGLIVASGETVRLRAEPTDEETAIRVPVTLTSGKDLVAFEVSVRFDPQTLRFTGIDRLGAAAEGLEYLSTSITEDRDVVRIGGVVDLTLRRPWRVGETLLGALRFEILRKDRVDGTAIDVADGIFVGDDGAAVRIAGEGTILAYDGESLTGELPVRLGLHLPNPMRAGTAIVLELPAAGPIQAEVFNVRGQKIRTLLARDLPAGSHELVWDGRTESGQEVVPGIYYLRVKSETAGLTRKVTLVR